MITPHLEKIFFHHTINTPSYMANVSGLFFEQPIYKTLFPLIKDFHTKYNKVPSLSQIQEIVRMNGEEGITSGQIETAWTIDLREYSETWLQDYTETWVEFKNLECSLTDAFHYMRSTTITPENIAEARNTIKDMIVARNSIDFDFKEGSDFFDPANHILPTTNTFSSGFPYIDIVSGGGFAAKTLTIFVGQAKVGKSIWLANIAAKAVCAGNNVAIITLEMSEAKYIKRIGSNVLGINMNTYQAVANNDQQQLKDKLSGLVFSNLTLPGKLWVKEFATSTASVQDIENYLRRIEEKNNIKFKIVVIDYINIMKNWRNPNTENTYMKIKQIAEDVRAMAQNNNWAVVSATQTKQSAFDEADMAMNAVAESSGLVATVDTLFAIIQNPMMYVGRKYKLKTLANRDEGYKNSSKIFDIDYDHMRISEDPTSGISDGGLI